MFLCDGAWSFLACGVGLGSFTPLLVSLRVGAPQAYREGWMFYFYSFDPVPLILIFSATFSWMYLFFLLIHPHFKHNIFFPNYRLSHLLEHVFKLLPLCLEPVIPPGLGWRAPAAQGTSRRPLHADLLQAGSATPVVGPREVPHPAAAVEVMPVDIQVFHVCKVCVTCWRLIVPELFHSCE